MSKTYTATGITLKSVPFGENDRLLTILTPEFGLVRAVAPGARKHKSSLRGRSGLFVVNHLLIVRGRSLDKVIQADSVMSFSTFSKDLGKLTAGQYLAELVLFQALSQHPQDELYAITREFLARLEAEPPSATLAALVRAIYALLAYGGIAPQVLRCCATQRAVQPDFNNPQWRVEFDTTAGGIVTSVPGEVESSSSECDRYESNSEVSYPSGSVVADEPDYRAIVRSPTAAYAMSSVVDAQSRHNGLLQNSSQNLSNVPHRNQSSSRKIELTTQLTAAELAALQWIAQVDQQRETMQSLDAQQIEASRSFEQATGETVGDRPISDQTWLSLERLLRHYAQYHFDQSIRSAALIETCFLMAPPSL